MKKKLFSAAIVAAIIFTITGLTVLAATANWHEKLIEYFNPTKEQMQQLESSVNTPLVTAENNGVRVDILQTIADKHGIYVLYDVTLPKDIKITQDIIDQDLQWDNDFLEIEIEQDSQGLGSIERSMSKIVSFSDNKMTILKNQGGNEKQASNQKIAFTLENLSYYTRTDNDIIKHVLAPCSLELSWSFDYQDIGKTIEVNKAFDINGTNQTMLKKIDVSPMSVWMIMEGDSTIEAVRPVIHLKDGTKIQIEAKNDFNTTFAFASFRDKDGGRLNIGYNFDRITESSEIESITVGDLNVSVN